jgi:hypothetical protein
MAPLSLRVAQAHKYEPGRRYREGDCVRHRSLVLMKTRVGWRICAVGTPPQRAALSGAGS